MPHLKAALSRTLQLLLVLWAVVTILFLMFRPEGLFGQQRVKRV